MSRKVEATYICDSCGRTKIEEWMFPAGWWELDNRSYGEGDEPAIESFDLCSWECVRDLALGKT